MKFRNIYNFINVNVLEYLTDKYALWLDFRTIDENFLHGTGRRIENASEGITLQIEKKEESAGALRDGPFFFIGGGGGVYLFRKKNCLQAVVG